MILHVQANGPFEVEIAREAVSKAWPSCTEQGGIVSCLGVEPLQDLCQVLEDADSHYQGVRDKGRARAAASLRHRVIDKIVEHGGTVPQCRKRGSVRFEVRS